MRAAALLLALSSPPAEAPAVDEARDAAPSDAEAPAEPEIDDPFAAEDDAFAAPEDAADGSRAPAPPPGGFGSVDSVSVDSDVRAPEPPPEDDGVAEGPTKEVGLRVDVGFAQTDLGNERPLDHIGLHMRAGLQIYPFVTPNRRFGVGVGLAYAYRGLNRRLSDDPDEFERSQAQQHQFTVGLELLLRPHRDWFSIQLSPEIGAATYSGKELLIADRRARLRSREVAFVAGGTLGLCTAYDILCLTGGSHYVAGVSSLASGPSASGERLDTGLWGWQIGIGFDILRLLTRGNRVDS